MLAVTSTFAQQSETPQQPRKIEAFWRHQPAATLCSDCVRTSLALKRRDGDVVRVYHASWDDSQLVTPELRNLRHLALELRAARAPR